MIEHPERSEDCRLQSCSGADCMHKMSELTNPERRSLERFLDLEISLDEFRNLARRRLTFDFAPSGPYTRSLQKHTDPAEPGVPVRRVHLVCAYRKWRANEIDAAQLADWAAMLVMNDDYNLDENEQDLIAEWLNTVITDLSLIHI